MTWHYAVGAIGTAFLYAAPFLYAGWRTRDRKPSRPLADLDERDCRGLPR